MVSDWTKCRYFQRITEQVVNLIFKMDLLKSSLSILMISFENSERGSIIFCSWF